jgi:hypothetical protein
MNGSMKKEGITISTIRSSMIYLGPSDLVHKC